MNPLQNPTSSPSDEPIASPLPPSIRLHLRDFPPRTRDARTRQFLSRFCTRRSCPSTKSTQVPAQTCVLRASLPQGDIPYSRFIAIMKTSASVLAWASALLAASPAVAMETCVSLFLSHPGENVTDFSRFSVPHLKQRV